MRDTERLEEALSVINSLKRKYNVKGNEVLFGHLSKIIELSESYGIDSADLDFEGNLRARSYYDFEIKRTPYCTVPTTKFTFPPDVYYIQVLNGNVGRLTFRCNEQAIYTTEANIIYSNFVDTILSYNPVEYDRMNVNYIFTVEDGYKLYKDFNAIHDEYQNLFDKLSREYEIKILKKKLERLEQADV